MAKKKQTVSNAELIGGDFFNTSFTEENKNSIVSEKRTEEKKETKKPKKRGKKSRGVVEDKIPFIFEKITSKGNKPIYLDEDNNERIAKLSFLLNLDKRQIVSNIISEFFNEYEDDLNDLAARKISF